MSKREPIPQNNIMKTTIHKFLICLLTAFVLIFVACEREKIAPFPEQIKNFPAKTKSNNLRVGLSGNLLIEETIPNKSTKTIFSEMLPARSELIFKNFGPTELRVCVTSSLGVYCVSTGVLLNPGEEKKIRFEELGGNLGDKNINATNPDQIMEGLLALL